MTVSCLVFTMMSAGSLVPNHLRCEALENPVGIGTAEPRLSWKLSATNDKLTNLSQSAFRILVASDPKQLEQDKGDLWDSGLVKSSESLNIDYDGRQLASGQACWWKVQVLDQDGNASGWSKPAAWSTGLLKKSDWQAQWIGFDRPYNIKQTKDTFDGASWIWGQGSRPAPEVKFEKGFAVNAGLVKATLHITADDQFSADVNGKKAAASDGKTDAWRRNIDTDITKLLTSGQNKIHVTATNTEGEQAGMIAKIVLTYPGGKTEEIVTDGSWLAGSSAAKVIGTYGIGPWNKVGPKKLHLPAARVLRHEFQTTKKVKRATLYGSALGLLELRLNGKAVTDELFMPGWTDYEKRVYSRAYDVTKSIKTGGNAIGVLLGDGWYSGYVGYGNNRDLYGKKIRALVQLDVEYTDGTKDVIASSPDWKATTGPILESDFLMGEIYNAELEQPGWDQPGFSATGWSRVDTGAEVNPLVESFPGQPVRRYAEIKAKKVVKSGTDTYIMDLGQNLAGFARLKVKGTKGQKIVLRFAERLNTDGSFYVTNLRSARATDTYICKGEGVETWEPKFTFHGFQYIEVTGLGHKPGANEVVGIAISSDTPSVGTIVTSDKMLNQLVSNAWWTQRMNFIDVPTDCPQRDERLGWTGDAQAYVRTAAMLTDVQPFFNKWLVSLEDAQREDGQFPMVAPLKVAEGDGGPAWADAGVICPWTIYDVYGDQNVLVKHYDSMKKFVDFCEKRSTFDYLPPKNFHCFGDWLDINTSTPKEVIYTAYFAGSARLVSQAAAVLGKTNDAERYEKLYQNVRSAFRKTYVSEGGKVHGDSQCSYILALVFDLLSPEEAKSAGTRLVADIEKRGWHLSTGFVGTRDIMHVLSKIGRNDVAFRLLHNTTFPSWGFTIANGATSIWERWDGWTPEKGFQDAGMNSFAHYAFGAVIGWVMAQPAGITNLEPGFKVVKVAPQIDPKLTWLKSSYDSVRGKITSEWSLKDGKLMMHVIVPPNTTAEIHVPTKGEVIAPAGASAKGSVSGAKVFEVGSGDYMFTSSY